MALVLPQALREELLEHARGGDPDEVCGILAGQGDRIDRIFPIRNAAEEIGADRGVFRNRQTGEASTGRRPVHYYMDPKDQLRVYNEIDDLGLELIGYYHSHTRSEARPSPTDIRLATDLTAYYILISLSEQPPVRAWKIAKHDPAAEMGEALEVSIQGALSG
jgi:proteasome lid subunit RPN8/RPN11